MVSGGFVWLLDNVIDCVLVSVDESVVCEVDSDGDVEVSVCVDEDSDSVGRTLDSVEEIVVCTTVVTLVKKN